MDREKMLAKIAELRSQDTRVPRVQSAAKRDADVAAMPDGPAKESMLRVLAKEESYVKCAGMGMPAQLGTDRDGLTGICPECHARIGLRVPEGEHAEDGEAVLVSHLAGGKTPPLSAGTKGVRTAEPARSYGQNVTYRGNTPADVAELPPVVRGADMPAIQPKPKMHKGQEVPSNGTMAGGVGRPHLVTNTGAELAGGTAARQLLGDGALTKKALGELSRSQQRKYWAKLKRLRDARRETNARRREYERTLGSEPVCGTGPTAARHFDSMPTGTRTGQYWDPSKGGRFVDTVARRAGEVSPLRGMRIDSKPFGVKHAVQAWEDKGR